MAFSPPSASPGAASAPSSSWVSGLVGAAIGAAAAALVMRSQAGHVPPKPEPTPASAAGSATPRVAPDADGRPRVLRRSPSRRSSITGELLGPLPWAAKGGEREFKLSDVRVITDMSVEELRLLVVPTLSELAPEHDAKLVNDRGDVSDEQGHAVKFRNVIGDEHAIMGDIVRKVGMAPVSRAYVRGGPRARTYFDPSRVRAAIVSCGGLCPGMNNVIRELVRSLLGTYRAEAVFAVRNGYRGFHESALKPLTLASVEGIQKYGGSVLGAARGGFDTDKILAALEENRINQLYVIGGDGTHRGAQVIFEALKARRLPIAVVGIPKTIDNDIDIIDHSFGFTTAVEAAQEAIQSAKVEASCAPNGVGIVKLMGRHAGFIAAHATLASGEVDLCLVPEVPVELEGPCGVFKHIEARLAEKGHVVIVVAEGAGEELLVADPSKLEVDAGGNRKLPPIGPWLRDRIKAHLSSLKIAHNLKYIDPSYIIRSVPANADDSLLCMLLAQNAVHGAMAGLTGLSVGLCNNRVVYLPITAIVANSPRSMDPVGRTWERVIASTGQPNTVREKLRLESKGPAAFAAALASGAAAGGGGGGGGGGGASVCVESFTAAQEGKDEEAEEVTEVVGDSGIDAALRSPTLASATSVSLTNAVTDKDGFEHRPVTREASLE